MSSRLSASLRLCAILLVASPTLGAEPLVWKWKVGDAPRYVMTQTMRMSMDAGAAGETTGSMRQDTLMQWKVDSVEPNGEAKLTVQTERVVMQNEGPGGQSFTYDSESQDPPMGMAALVAPVYEAVVEHPVYLTMQPSGELKEIKLSDELKAAFDRLPGGAVSGDMAVQTIRQMVVELPKEPLAVGDQWTNTVNFDTPGMGSVKVETTYTYDGPGEIEGNMYEAFTPKVAETALDKQRQAVEIETKDSTGEILFDREKGRVYSSRVIREMQVRMKSGEQETVNTIEQAVELRELGKDENPTLGAAAEEEAAEEEAEASPTEEPAATK